MHFAVMGLNIPMHDRSFLQSAQWPNATPVQQELRCTQSAKRLVRQLRLKLSCASHFDACCAAQGGLGISSSTVQSNLI